MTAELITQIENLKGTPVKSIVEQKISSFKRTKSWFSELCFCILTSNSKANTALNIQAQLGEEGFLSLSENDLSQVIRSNHHRFHNVKARYIILARQFSNIKEIIQDIAGNPDKGDVSSKGVIEAREWLVENVKGLGYKEASHFLRNVGYENVAILDRHIVRLLFENNYVNHYTNSFSRKSYLEYERVLAKICKEVGLSQAELDLYLWYIKTGRILK